MEGRGIQIPHPSIRFSEDMKMTIPPVPEQPGQPEQRAAAEVPAAPAQPAPAAPQQPQAPQYSAPQQPAPPAYPVPQQHAVPPVPGQATPQQPQPPHYGVPQQPATPAAAQQPQAPQYAAAQPPQYGQQQYGQPQYGQQPYAANPAFGAMPGPGGYFDGAVSEDDLTRPLYGATFGQAIKRFFKNYAKFSGRASRTEYWWAYLFISLIQIVPIFFMIIGGVMLGSYTSYSIGMLFLILGIALLIVISLGLLVPIYALTWRRLQDANFAGPLALLHLASIIPYIGWLGSIAVLVLTVMPSKYEGRRFDPQRFV